MIDSHYIRNLKDTREIVAKTKLYPTKDGVLFFDLHQNEIRDASAINPEALLIDNVRFRELKKYYQIDNKKETKFVLKNNIDLYNLAIECMPIVAKIASAKTISLAYNETIGKLNFMFEFYKFEQLFETGEFEPYCDRLIKQALGDERISIEIKFFDDQIRLFYSNGSVIVIVIR